jgi:polygalacturonase
MRKVHRTIAAVVAHAGPVARRRFFMAGLLVFLLGLCMPYAARASSVVAYPVAAHYVKATSWKITAKGTDGVTVPIDARAYDPNGDGTLTAGCYYCHCAINGSTTFAIDATQTITTYSISPKSYKITGTLSNGTATNSVLTFTIPSTKYLEINIAGKKAVLCLLADPFETNAPPSSGAGIYNVTASPYDADDTGNTNTYQAIQDAIDDANTDGGGIVYFPPGVYKTGTLTLKSNVTLYFAGGSVLYADTNPPTGQHQWAAHSNYLIQASNTTNIEIYGRGELDCRGSDISNNPSVNGGPQIGPICIDNVNGISMYGIVANDSSEFTIHPSQGSSNINIANVKVINRYDWLWNDGMDFTDSNTGTVTHCFVRTDDDACTVKTGYSGTPHASFGITYNDMVVDTNSGCGFCAGAETNADIYTITAENFNVIECNRALALLHRNGPGSWHNMTFETWTVDDIDNGYNGGKWNTNNKPPLQSGSYCCAIEMEVYNKGSGVGPISSILCQDMTFLSHGPTASYLWGNSATNNISGVTFNNLVIYNTNSQPVQITSLTTQVDGQEAIWNMGYASNIQFHSTP